MNNTHTTCELCGIEIDTKNGVDTVHIIPTELENTLNKDEAIVCFKCFIKHLKEECQK